MTSNSDIVNPTESACCVFVSISTRPLPPFPTVSRSRLDGAGFLPYPRRRVPRIPGLPTMACAIATLSVAVGVSAARADDSAAAQLARGDQACTKLDLAGALAAYRRAHELAPENFEADWKLARALTDEATLSTDSDEQKRLCAEAERLARAAVALEPENPKGHDYLAIAVGKLALFEGGKRKVDLSKEVKAEAENALQLDPDDDLALHVLAIWNREMVELPWLLKTAAHLLYGKLPPASLADAVSDLEKAVKLRPDVIPHHVELGITLAAAKRWREAESELEKGLSLPTGWVTDSHYRDLARRELAKVKRHLE
jgi:tetratricopeptide (TPR) repeat protein